MNWNYTNIYKPGHPLAQKNGYLRRSRYVLFTAIGPGAHPCHWCGISVTWDIRGRRGGLYVDHVDRDTRNDVVGNLVPSCNRCNSTRAKPGIIAPDEPSVCYTGDHQRRATERTCLHCGTTFLWAKATKSRTGEYCSHRCALIHRNTTTMRKYDGPTVETRQCIRCGADFQHQASDRRPGVGRFCSRSCAAIYHNLGQRRRKHDVS